MVGGFFEMFFEGKLDVILLIWERVNDEECRLLRCSRKLHKSHVIVLPAPTGGSHTAAGPGERQTRSVELFRLFLI